MKDALNALDREFEYSSKDYMSCVLAYFFGNISPKIALEELNTVKAPTSICGKSIMRSDILWMCADCSKLGSSTCYCQECFDVEKHKLHKYSYQIGTEGCCDCGDDHSLKAETFCKKHESPAKEDAGISLLPDYYKVYGPIIWEHIMRKLHKVLCDIEPGQLSPPSVCRVKILHTVLLLLSNIFRISPLFHKFLADALVMSFS